MKAPTKCENLTSVDAPDGARCSAIDDPCDFDDLRGFPFKMRCEKARQQGKCTKREAGYLYDIGILVAAWGRHDLFNQHILALGHTVGDICVEYVVGTTTGGWLSKHDAIKKQAQWAVTTRCVSVTTDKAWPLPLVYNAALMTSTANVVLVVGSDVIVPDGLLQDAMNVPEGVARLYTTYDADGREFVGPGRMVALPYCMAIHRKHILDIGGWDVIFADGICYDDNDFAARLLISGVRFEWCDEFRCIHQTHKRYHGENQRALVALNHAIWLDRLNGYPGPLWPVANETQGGDGAQEALAEALAGHGYRFDCECV